MGIWWRWREGFANAIGLDVTHAQSRYWRLVEREIKPGERWLDIGCGRQIVPDWAASLEEQRAVAARCKTLTGVDADRAMQEHPLLHTRVWGLGGQLPFRDASFSFISANMVAEHLAEPGVFLRDVHRVLEHGGRFAFHTPNFRFPLIRVADLVPDPIKKEIIWKLERRKAEDVFPVFYRLNTPEDIGREAAAAGFRVKLCQTVGSSGSFGAVPLLGLAECLPMRAIQSARAGRWNSNLLVVLSRD